MSSWKLACPGCGEPTLAWHDLMMLSRRTPAICGSCDALIVNARWRTPLGVLLGGTLAMGLIWFTGGLFPGLLRSIVPGIVGVLLVHLAIAVTAVPEVLPPGKPKLCSECGRENVGYYGWEHRTCARCVDRIERDIIKGVRTTRTPRLPPAPTQVADAPEILRQLKRSGKDGSFAALIIRPSLKSSRTVSIQFSIEEGRVGLDWVLLDQQSQEDRERFAEAATRLGHRVQALEMNGVAYLRVEDGDLVELFVALTRDLYGLTPETEIELVAEDFEWEKGRA